VGLRLESTRLGVKGAGDGNRTTKGNKKAKVQIREVQEEIGGEVNESDVCERERGEGEKRNDMECDDVVSGEASGGSSTGGGGRASGLGRDGQVGGGGKPGVLV
jgi:hypothetical protein